MSRIGLFPMLLYNDQALRDGDLLGPATLAIGIIFYHRPEDGECNVIHLAFADPLLGTV